MKLMHIIILIEFIVTVIFAILMVKFYKIEDYTNSAHMTFAFLISFTVLFATTVLRHKNDDNFFSDDGMS